MKKRKTVRIAAALLVVLACAGLLVGAAAPREAAIVEDVKPVVVVNTATPVRSDLAVTGEFIATVEPSQQVAVIPKAAGEVLAVYYGVGDYVEEGDVLFEIDSTTLRSNIAQTQAAVSSAQAKAQASLELAQQNLESYNQGLADGTNANVISAEAAVRSAENRLQTAQVSLSTARRTLRDHLDLDEDGFVPGLSGLDFDQTTRQYRDQVSQAQLAVEAAEIALQQAQDGLGATMSGLSDQETGLNTNVKVAQLNTNFSDQQIAIQQMQRTLEDYIVKAPISGIIEQCAVEVHDMVSGQQAVFVISQKDAMTITFQVAEETVSSMRLGDAVSVEKDGRSCEAAVYEISTMVNVQGGLYTVKASVENAPFELHTGSTVKVSAATKKAKNAVTLPVGAVYFEDGSAFVYRYENGVLHKVSVETGITDNVTIQIVSGLSLTDQVATTWNSGLRDGLEVVHADDVAPLTSTMEYSAEGGENVADAPQGGEVPA